MGSEFARPFRRGRPKFFTSSHERRIRRAAALAFFENSAILCVTNDVRKKWRRLEAMMAKRQLDMLHGSVWNKIPQFALPLAAILGRLFNAVDIAVVGNFTGDMRTAVVAALTASDILNVVLNL